MVFALAAEKDRADVLTLYRALAGLEFSTWTEEYPNEANVDDDLARNALFCLRDEDGSLAGTISFDADEQVDALPCWSAELQPSGELARLGVRPDLQNRGLARQLLQYGMDELRRRGMKSAHFLVSKANVNALRSYAKLDFNVAGECELYGEQWLCYEKPL